MYTILEALWTIGLLNLSLNSLSVSKTSEKASREVVNRLGVDNNWNSNQSCCGNGHPSDCSDRHALHLAMDPRQKPIPQRFQEREEEDAYQNCSNQ